MKKSTFVAMILGTIGGILFALGMCMALIPEWNAFRSGVTMGVIGAVVLLIMVLVWRKMENKEPIRISGKTIGAAVIGIHRFSVVGRWNVPYNGMEPYDRRNCHRYCGNHCSSLPDSFRKRFKIRMQIKGVAK